MNEVKMYANLVFCPAAYVALINPKYMLNKLVYDE
jgi:hypothetical protein